MPPLDSIPQALDALRALQAQPPTSRGRWDLAQVLHHLAQSIEYSMTGFPALKPGWFRASVGPLAFQVFGLRGRMSHGLDLPIPGAPALAPGQPLAPAFERLTKALQDFEAFAGPLQPHFAYGALAKPAYTRAHLFHIADHWREFE
jgi:hypothetical protein